MGFTEAQRLKGLKKQLKNLGFDVVQSGAGSPFVDEGGNAPEDDLKPGERGYATIMRLRAVEEAW